MNNNRQCTCTFAQKMVGDGCDVCNPETSNNMENGMKTITQLVTESHATALEKGWWDKPRTDGECIALMHSELSEALEEVRKPRCAINENWYQPDGKPEGVGAELADTVIRIADFCGYHGIDLEAIIIEKMEYNKTRSARHGEKVL